MTFKEVVQKVLRDFEKTNTLLSPDAYKVALCKELQKAGISHQDCEQLQKSISKLSPEHQKSLKMYPIKTIDEFNQFLISQLNRTAPNETNIYIDLLVSLCESMCDSTVLLKHHDATILANTTKDKLHNSKNLETITSLKKEWAHFAASYNDNLFDELEPYVKIHKTNWETIIEDIKRALKVTNDPALILDTLIKALKPSFAAGLETEIQALSAKISKDPSVLKSSEFHKSIADLVDKRIDLDKKELKKKLKEIDSTLEIISNALSVAERAGIGSSDNIGSLKTMISDANGINFDSIKQKMLYLATTIEKDITTVTTLVKDESSQITKMQQRISELETQLEATKKDASVDFLTKLLNRKVLEEALVNLENLYTTKNETYSIVFFDIDHFKGINDKYGHLAGDAILSAFASIIQKKAKGESYVGRWGGEEFVMALPKKSRKEAYELADQIRAIIMQTKFMYKTTQINVTTSAGVAERNECDDLRQTLKMADERLYLAKTSGRNRVEPS